MPFLSVIENFLNWLADGWDILTRIFFWCAQGVAWLIGLMFLYGLLMLLMMLFWKDEVGDAARKSCLLHVAVFIACSVIAAVIVKCDKSKERDEQLHGIMGSGGDIEDGVFICTGSHSHSYHLYSDCMGLGNCSGEIMKISLEDAQEEGRHLCGFCDKREQ